MRFQVLLRKGVLIGATLRRHPLLVLGTIGAVHRIVVFVRFQSEIDLLANRLGNLALIQLLPLGVYRQHFSAAILQLQQTPPIPHFVVQAALLVSAFPIGFTHILFCLQSGIAVATACLLLCIIRTITGSLFTGFALSLWFMLSTDLLVLEDVFFCQAFYENLSMLFITACCAVSICSSAGTGINIRLGASAAGVFAALAALTRSSVCYYDIVPLIAIRQFRTLRLIIMFLAPVVVLQGGWALKNALIYGDLSWETSTWGGYSAASGLVAYGLGPTLCNDILGSPTGSYPPWFLRSVRTCPPPFFNSSDTEMPNDIQARDMAIRARLGNFDIPLNTIAARMKSGQYAKAVIHFAEWHPFVFAERFMQLYPLFWQRMADYGAMFPDVFSIKRVPLELTDLLPRGFNERQRVALLDQPKWWPLLYRKAMLWTVSFAPMDAVSIVVLHGIFPLLVVAELWQRLRGRSSVFPPGSAMLAWTALYGLIVFNAVDSGENMRFRLTVEPVIIALTAVCILVSLRGSANALHLVRKKALCIGLDICNGRCDR